MPADHHHRTTARQSDTLPDLSRLKLHSFVFDPTPWQSLLLSGREED